MNELNNNNNKNELLFWKIFRNIYLFNKIINSIVLYKRPGYYLYDEVTNVEWMIQTNNIELLKLKVYRNDLLNFYCSSINYKSRSKNRISYDKDDFNNLKINLHAHKLLEYQNQTPYYQNSIFNIFHEDYEFFSCLFKNYKIYFQFPKSLKEIERFSIEYDNIAIYKVLIKEYNFKPKSLLNSFIKSFNFGSLKISNYLYELNQEQQSFNLNNDKELKFELWNISINEIQDLSLIYKRIHFLIYKLNLKPIKSVISKLESLCFNFNIDKKPLGKLYNCCKIISILTIEQPSPTTTTTTTTTTNDSVVYQDIEYYFHSKYKEKIKFFPTKEYLIIKNQFFKLLELKEILDMKFTKKELSRLVCEFTFDNLNVKKLFSMFLRFTSFSKEVLFENYSYLKNNFNEEASSNYYKTELIKFIKLDNLKMVEKILGGGCLLPFKEKPELFEKYVTKPFNHIQSIEMFDLIYNYLKINNIIKFVGGINSSVTPLIDILYKYKLVNHFKKQYSKDYYVQLKLLVLVDRSVYYNTESLIFQDKFQFFFENLNDFSNKQKSFLIGCINMVITYRDEINLSKSNYLQLIKLSSSSSGYSSITISKKNTSNILNQLSILYDYLEPIQFIQFIQKNEFLFSILLILKYYRGDLISFLEIDHYKTTFKFNNNYYYNTISVFNKLIIEILNRGDLKIIKEIMELSQFSLKQELILINFQESNLNFLKVYKFLKNLNDEIDIKLNNYLLSNGFKFIKNLILYGNIDAIIYLKENKFNIDNYLEDCKKEFGFNNNNCFTYYYLFK